MKLLLILGTFLCLAKSQENEATLKSLLVTSDIKVRYARTIVSAEYFNDKNSPTIAKFHVILPVRAYITNFSMEMDDEISVGVVKPKNEAKKIFDEAVKQGESAGYVAVKHRFTKKFDMKVNVEPNKKVVFNLTYEELLRRSHGNYSHQIFLTNGKIIDNVLVEVFISEPQDIRVLEENVPANTSVRSVDYIDNRHVYIKFEPTIEEQKEMAKYGHSGVFNVEYDVERNNTNILYTLDGYFVHFFSPDDQPIWPKNVVFMVDVSGSMSGQKLKQVKMALHSILLSLDPHKDIFTIGTFSNQVTWQDSNSLEKAQEFIESLNAKGGTDINQAMLASLRKLEEKSPANTADILFFLTDGEPTSGITDKKVIRENVKMANNRKAMIFMLGFGEDCDHHFLRTIASENHGFGRKIYIDEDSDNQIKDMFSDISDLLLKNVIITYVDSSIEVGSVTRHEFKTLFKGTEVAIAGRIKDKNQKSIMTKIWAEGAASNYTRIEKLKIMDFDLDDMIFGDIPETPNITRLDQLQEITKKTWAYLTLKEMFKNNAPTEDIVKHALEHGFVTPLTSMVVTKKYFLGDVSDEVGERNGVALASRSHPPKPGLPGLPDQPKPGLPGLMPAKKISQGIQSINTLAEASRKLFGIVRSTMRAMTTSIGTSSTPTTTPGITTTTTTTTIPSTTVSRSVVPKLPKIPAIIVKPSECDLNLCVSQKNDCMNGSKILILKDTRADVEVYGESERRSPRTCIDDLFKLTVQSKRKTIQITPDFVSVNKKRLDSSKRNSVRFQFKKFFRVEVFFNRKQKNKKTISVRFFIQDYLKRAQGLYGNFMKRFSCRVQPTAEVTLSHVNRKFRKVTFESPETGFDHCFM